MKKIIGWVLNHLKIVLAIVTFTTVIVVVGLVMLNSYNSYLQYQEEYYANDLETRSALPPAPKGVFLDNSYKSTLKNELESDEEELVVEGNNVSLSLTIDEKSFVDMEFVIVSLAEPTPASEDSEEIPALIEDLLLETSFKVNDSLVEGLIDVEGNDECHLIMSGFAIAEGEINIVIDTKAQISVSSIVVYSNAVVTYND